VDKLGYIEIKIVGSRGKLDSTPDNYDNKEIIYYDPAYDEEYLTKLRRKAKKSWQGITDPDKWLREMRKGFNA
jgi:hypothetical protein